MIASLFHKSVLLSIFDFMLINIHLNYSIDSGIKAVYHYKKSFESFEITKGGKMLSSGIVIIAINLAGRGTDIKIGPDLEKKGGLHVIFEYLPNNIRVEQRAFVRSARMGQNGSGRLIFVNPSSDPDPSLMHLKRDRDVNELLRISEIKIYY